MKTYSGYINENQDTVVLVDGKPLFHVVLHSPTGFNWGYHGSGPADLALSILADYFDERPTRTELEWGDCNCWRYHQDFKRKFIATIDPDEHWKIPGTMIDSWIAMQEAKRAYD